MMTPFPYQELKSYSGEEAGLFSFLSRCFPRGAGESEVVRKVGARVGRLLGGDVSLRFDSFTQTRFSLLKSTLPADPVVLVMSLTPHPQKIIIETGIDLAWIIIDRLLGGGGDVEAVQRPLTSLEEGVVQYFALKLLTEIKPLMSERAGEFTLERLVTSVQNFPEISEAGELYCQLHFKVYFKPYRSYVRISLPLSLLTSLKEGPGLFIDSEKSGDGDAVLARLGDFKTVLWAEAGRVSLSPSEISHLERDDIVLFDETLSHFDGKQLAGLVKIWVGDGTKGGFEAAVTDTNNQYQMKLTKVFQSHE